MTIKERELLKKKEVAYYNNMIISVRVFGGDDAYTHQLEIEWSLLHDLCVELIGEGYDDDILPVVRYCNGRNIVLESYKGKVITTGVFSSCITEDGKCLK